MLFSGVVIKARDAEVISPWLVTSTTQRQDPCSGPTMDSMITRVAKKRGMEP